MVSKSRIKRTCPFCSVDSADILEHIRISHEIESVENFNEKMTELERRNNKQRAYRDYVLELQDKEKNGEISAEEYRRRITEWIKQHQT